MYLDIKWVNLRHTLAVAAAVKDINNITHAKHYAIASERSDQAALFQREVWRECQNVTFLHNPPGRTTLAAATIVKDINKITYTKHYAIASERSDQAALFQREVWRECQNVTFLHNPPGRTTLAAAIVKDINNITHTKHYAKRVE